MKPTDSRSVHRLQLILDALLERDLDQKQLQKRVFLTDARSLIPYMKYLRGRNQAHVCGWREPGVNGHRWPIWRFGKGVNVPKPAPKTNAELMRVYWRKKGRGTQPAPLPVASPFGALFTMQEQRA